MRMRTLTLVVAKNMAVLRTRQAAIAQCGRHIDWCVRFGDTQTLPYRPVAEEINFWLAVVDHLENTNFD